LSILLKKGIKGEAFLDLEWRKDGGSASRDEGIFTGVREGRGVVSTIFYEQGKTAGYLSAGRGNPSKI